MRATVLGPVLAGCLLAGNAAASDTVRLAIQKTGTVAWELDVIRRHGLDRQAGLTLETLELASPEAGKIALRGGSADVIVSDWLWVTRERSLGAKLLFYPYSSALGAVMALPTSSIRVLSDLPGHKIGVAGGPIDKSWLLMQAAMRQTGTDLSKEATIVYGAPTLLAEKTLQGEMDATLNFWNICASLEAKGLRRIGGVEDVLPKLGITGRPAMVGYVFEETWATRHRDLLSRFIEMTRRAKDILANSDSEWQQIAPLVGTSDASVLRIYRDRYRDGIPRRSVAKDEEDARTLFGVLAKVGGAGLVGPARELDPGTFYRTPSGS